MLATSRACTSLPNPSVDCECPPRLLRQRRALQQSRNLLSPLVPHIIVSAGIMCDCAVTAVPEPRKSLHFELLFDENSVEPKIFLKFVNALKKQPNKVGQG